MFKSKQEKEAGGGGKENGVTVPASSTSASQVVEAETKTGKWRATMWSAHCNLMFPFAHLSGVGVGGWGGGADR